MNRPKLVHILALVLAFSGVMKATILLPVYTPIACGGQGQVACSVTPTGVTPTSAQLQGLTTTLAATYLNSQLNLNVNPTSLSLSPLVANVNGYVIGGMTDQNAVITQFIYHTGQVTCCTEDRPFSLADINDQNIVAGQIFSGFALIPFVGDASVMNADRNPLTLTFTDPTFARHLFGAYTAIDNQNRILFQEANGQEWILDPANPANNPSTVPEPSSVFLLLTVVLGVGFTMRQRLFRPTA
jgi:hypothetical protein